MKQILKSGVSYFAFVFVVGFLLGIIRTVWVVPWVGVRTAELAEAPVMVAVSVFAARSVSRGIGFPADWPKRLTSGLVALGLMLVAEFGFVLWVRGLTIREYIESRDPISGAVYFVALGVFGLIPLFVRWRATPILCSLENRSSLRKLR